MTLVAPMLALISGLVALGNIAGIAAAVLRRKGGSDRGFSCVPLVSAILAGLSSLFGYAALGWWPLLIPLLDPATWTLPFILRELWNSRARPS